MTTRIGRGAGVIALGFMGACELVAGLGGERAYPATSDAGTGTTLPPAHCGNGVEDGDETSKDCGGSCPDPCAVGEGCSAGSDCTSKVCGGGICTAPACDDKVRNGDETDIDCGGPVCPVCANGKVCSIGADCQSGICEGGTCANPFKWQRHIDNVGFAGLARDTIGNVAVASWFTGTTDLGGGPVTTAGGADAALVKYDPLGVNVWNSVIGGAKDQSPRGLAMDPSGNVILVGDLTGSSQYGGYPLNCAGSADAFVLKLDTAGLFKWDHVWGDASYQAARAVVADGTGVIVAGYFHGQIAAGSTVLSSAGASDLFLVKMDPGGVVVWAKRFGDVLVQAGDTMFLGTDAAGNVVWSFGMTGTVDLGGGKPLGTGSGAEVFLAKFDKDGGHLWSHAYGKSGNHTVGGLALAPNGEVLLAGSFAGAIDFGGGALTNAGDADAFLVKFDGAGNQVWARAFGDDQVQAGYGVDLDASGHVYLTGAFAGTADFGGGALTSAGGYDIFVAKFDSLGGHVWSRRYGDSGDQAGRSIAVLEAQDVIVAGRFDGVIDFGGGPLAGTSENNVFLARLHTP